MTISRRTIRPKGPTGHPLTTSNRGTFTIFLKGSAVSSSNPSRRRQPPGVPSTTKIKQMMQCTRFLSFSPKIQSLSKVSEMGGGGAQECFSSSGMAPAKRYRIGGQVEKNFEVRGLTVTHIPRAENKADDALAKATEQGKALPPKLFLPGSHRASHRRNRRQ